MDNLLRQYNNLKNQEKELKKEIKRLNEIIKLEMKKRNITSYTIDGKTFHISIHDRSTIDRKKLLQILKDYKRLDLIETITEPDYEAIYHALNKGEVDPDILKDSVKEKYVEQLRVYKN